MIFKYSQKNKNGKVYIFKDLEEGETFMLSDPRKENVTFAECSVYMVIDDNKDDHAINLDNGHLLIIDFDREVYPVICECSVSLYPDVY